VGIAAVSERLPESDLDELDYLVPQYDARWFLDMAKRIESGQSLAAAARCFLQIANTPAAIKKLNHYRLLVPREILGLNRAFHYLVRLGLLREVKQVKLVKRARSEIAAVWGTKEATIKDDFGDFGKDAQRILERIVTHEQSRSRNRASVLKDFDSDMTHRAARMSKPPASKNRTLRTRRKK
jgi:hypothetical protein